MTTIAIYGVQAILGLTVMLFGAAHVADAEIVVRAFEAVGIGSSIRFGIGIAEIAAGLCLLMPRGGILGSAVLACVTVGMLGVSIGHVATRQGEPAVTQAPKAAAVSLYRGEFRPAAAWTTRRDPRLGLDI
jgi:hypothetical protein